MSEILGNEPQTADIKEDTHRDDWLSLARDAYRSSTDWLDQNLRHQFEKNMALFQSKHPKGSKYTSDLYSHRSKIFRPKTRSVVRRNEAAAAAAFFSTPNVASVDAVNEMDEAQVASASINQELLNYRLTKTIPWFLLCIGGVQEAQVNGVVISCQEWDMDLDKPKVRLIPVENFRIDPNCDWTDPINSSPYNVELMPMYILDVIERMKTDPRWKTFTEGELRAATKQTFDSTRQQRQAPRQDPQQMANHESQFDTVWIHRNIVRQGGQDWVWYTVGTELMLTDPVPLKEEVRHGERPYAMGYAIIEAHKVYPSGLVELTEGLQVAANDIQNQRFDNVQLVLNKRWRVRNNANVDIQALLRNVPGGVVAMNDPNNDVVMDETQDVTSSSYAEQDRLNVDFDELAGTFSQSSVQSNRQLNETVGGMSLMASGANQMTEFMIRTFSETWVEPVMRQIVKLEQCYESDGVILALAAEKAQLYQRYEINTIDEQLLRQELTVTVNVGVDATDPVKRIQKLSFGMDIIMKATQVPNIKLDEVVDEVFGKLGYKNTSRFFTGMDEEVDPQVQQLQQQVQQLMQAIEGEKVKTQNQIELENAKADNKLKELSYQSQLQVNPMAVPQDATQAFMQQFSGQLQQFMDMFKTEHEAFGDRLERVEYGVRGLTSALDNHGQARVDDNTRSMQTQSQLNNALQNIMYGLENLKQSVSALVDRANAKVIPHRDTQGRLVAIETEGFGLKSVARDDEGNVVTIQ